MTISLIMSKPGCRARALLYAAGTVAALSAAAVLPLSTASAAADSFGASASAHGFDFTYSNDSLPGVQTYELAAPSAGATLNSAGNSQSFASAPYPGDVVANLPSFAGALVPVPVPAYPLYVAALPGDDPKTVSYPGIALRAEAGSTVVQGSGTFGSDGAGGVSTARAELWLTTASAGWPAPPTSTSTWARSSACRECPRARRRWRIPPEC